MPISSESQATEASDASCPRHAGILSSGAGDRGIRRRWPGIGGAALALALALAPAAPAWAEADAVVREALALAEGGQAARAYEMLEPLEVTRAGDPDFDLVFGIAANMNGQYARAVLALERATLAQPNNARARAELGRAMFQVGDSRSARTLLEQAKAQGAPNEAAQTIDQFLRAIDVAESLVQSSGKVWGELTIGHDSNVGSGPSVTNVAVPAFGGLVVPLNPGSIKRGAGFANLAVGASGRYVLDSRWSLIGNASFNKRINHEESPFNNDQFNVGGGASYRVDRQEFSVVVVHEEYRLSGAMNRLQNGLVGEWVYRIDGSREAGAYLQYSHLDYAGQPNRNANRVVLGGSYAQQLAGDWLGWGGLYVGRENATTSGFPQFGHRLAGVRLGVQKGISEQLAGFAAFNFEARRYGGPDPFFGVDRSDNQSSLSLGLSWVPMKALRVTPQVTFIRNNSNLVINDYDRTLVSVAARYEF